MRNLGLCREAGKRSSHFTFFASEENPRIDKLID
jgi:hypothetical protein